MSLIHWWPLNGNLYDLVGSNHLIYINNNNKLVINNNGKLGKCYERTATGTADLLRSTEPMKVFEEESICAWIYVSQHAALSTANGVVTNHDHNSNSGLGIGVYSTDGNNYYVSINAGNKSGRVHSTYWGNTNIKGAWHHVCLISDGSKIRMYVDGNEDRAAVSYSVYSKADYLDIFNWSTGYYTQSNYRPACKVCDVRVYDHALSVREIQELSKGLMLHYTFNDVGSESTTNLITGIKSAHGKSSLYGNGVKINWSPSGGDSYFMFNYSQAIKANGVYTLSFDCEGLKPGEVATFAVSNLSAASYNIALKNGRNSLTFTAGSDLMSDINTHNRLFFDDKTKTNGAVFYLSNFQLEEKDHATPYVNGSRNNPYYDESGYNNDGNQNQIDYTPNSNNGSYCASFNGTHSYIELPNWKPSLPNEPYTIAFWVNPGENKTRDIYFGNHPTTNGTFNIERNTNNYLRVYYNSDTPIGPISTITIPSGVWTHIVMTFDGTTFKAYKDSVEKYSKTLSQTLNCTNANWKIGSDYRTAVGTSEATRYKGLMSDFRIYASALTPAQVLELYESKAAIDKNQNVFTNEIIEQQNTNLVNADSWEQGDLTNFGGTNVDNMMNSLRTKYIPVMPNTKYDFLVATGYNVRCVHEYRSDMTWTKSSIVNAIGATTTTSSDCYYVRWVIQSTNASSEVPVTNIATYQPVMVIRDFASNYGFDTNTDVEVTNKYILKTKDIVEGHDVGFFKDGTASGNNFYEI